MAFNDSSKNSIKPDDYWRETLSEEAYYVCRQQGTEAPFSGKLLHNKQTGIYHCTCCEAPLFSSKSKYDSGCFLLAGYALVIVYPSLSAPLRI